MGNGERNPWRRDWAGTAESSEAEPGRAAELGGAKRRNCGGSASTKGTSSSIQQQHCGKPYGQSCGQSLGTGTTDRDAAILEI